MKEGSRNTLVGFFVVVSLAALATLMVWFGEAPSWLRQSEWTLQIVGVSDLQGIGEGSPVNLNGVEIGRVERLEFEDARRPDQGVVIVTGIQNLYSIPMGATARVYGATFGFGAGRIDIMLQPGQDAAPIPRKNARIPGEMRSIVGELVSKDLVNSVERAITNIGNLTGEWAPVGLNIAELLEQRSVDAVDAPDAAAKGMTPNFSTVVQRLDNLLGNLNAVLGDQNVQGDLKAVADNLKSTSEELRETVAMWKIETTRLANNLNEGFDKTEQNLDQSFLILNHALENLDDATTNLSHLMNRVTAGEGTLGLLARDARLYEAAVLSLRRFSEVMQNLLIITGKVRDDGYITVGQAPSGVPRKRFPIPTQAEETR